METPIRIIKKEEYENNVVRLVFGVNHLTNIGTEYCKTWSNEIAKYINGKYVGKIHRHWKLHKIMFKS